MTPEEQWKEEFDKNKSILIPRDEIVLVKTFNKKEYLHETLEEWDLMTGKITPRGFMVNTIPDGAIDEREVEMIEKSWKQSEVVIAFISSLLSSQKEALMRKVKAVIPKEVYSEELRVAYKSILKKLNEIE